MGKLDESVTALKTVLAQSPEHVMAHFWLGTAYELQHRDRDALQEYETALRFNPNLIDSLSQMARIYLAQGQPEKALARCAAQLTAAEASPQTHPVIYTLMGQIYSHQKQYAKAEAQFQQAIADDKNYLPAYFQLGALYVRQQSFDQAAKQYRDAIAAKPDVAPFYVLLGMIDDAQAKYSQAATQYEKALELDPQLVIAANNLAWNYAEHGGNIDTALSLAQRAKEQSPDDPNVADTLGWIYYKKNAYLTAVSILKESAAKLPDNPVAHYHLGMAYVKNGQKELAKHELEQALKLSQNFSGHEEARITLKQL